MNESKIELTKRLQREGRWDEASSFKDESIRKFRNKGMTKAEAGEEAWEAMATRYPPLPPAEHPPESAAKAPEAKPSEIPVAPASGRGENGHGTPVAPDDDFDVDALLERTGDQQPDLVRDVLWAYQHLENRKAKPDDAPSPGAWSMLKWGRQYRNRFFEQVLPKAMSNKLPEDEANERGERLAIAEIEKMLAGVRGNAEERLRKDLLADVPATVKAGVRSRLDDWTGRFELSLGDDARAGLEAHIAGFVHDCVKLHPVSRTG
jgi:hypothetical protein